MNVTFTQSAPGSAGVLDGKVAIVTGSTSGIGLGIARSFASAGASVVLNGFGDPDEINGTIEGLQTDGAKAVYSAADMTKPDKIADMVNLALESFGRLFKNDLRLFVYPMLRDGEVVTVDTVAVGEELQPLYDYLNRRGSFVDLDNYKPDYLPILSREVLLRIAAGDEVWESQVPNAVADLIKKRAFFGYHRPDQR